MQTTMNANTTMETKHETTAPNTTADVRNVIVTRRVGYSYESRDPPLEEKINHAPGLLLFITAGPM